MNKKILIVRGDRQNAKALSFLLAGSGYQISVQTSASDAIEAARHQRFDLAITDEELVENQSELSLVANLKETQPNLPILFLAEEKTVDCIINCIRAGVSEVIEDSRNIRDIIDATNSFLRDQYNPSVDDEVTWDDILEVERLLEASAAGAQATEHVSSAEVQKLEKKLEDTLKDRDEVAGKLSETLANLAKARVLVDELKNQNGMASTDSEIAQRSAELDDRERKLKEMSAKLSQQKFEVESQLAELEAQQIEFEEAQKDNPNQAVGGSPVDNEELEQERARSNAQRLELQATIQDLQREIQIVKANSHGSEELKEEIRLLKEQVQDSKENIAEKDFIIEQRDRELSDLRDQSSERASNPQVEELEDAKRLVEIERYKLQERIDQLELEKRLFEESHQKSQKEIQVERRDAEITLREMQNTIKEEQLKLKVDQATLREEMRQFEQARNNFQEDVQDLQSKQAELRKMEAYLNQMERSIKVNGAMAAEDTLPKPNREEAFGTIAAPQTDEHKEAPVMGSESSQSTENPQKPEGWGKPNMEKKAGRGPLRIGRRSSF
ncbi:response regulator [Pelagicoccus albus]|uniref:Response regulator n=1 Tax=Pelagicoccus albus TaxID=415222 RepID=A0A7X1B4E2_9BACT|nr:response regulator [Pelagicoccus albus]MBC2605410.1 response regulator [Pelagicoccus albus]